LGIQDTEEAKQSRVHLDRIKAKMVLALETLPFSTDMFVINTHRDKIAHTSVVDFILTAVRLNDTEVQVVRAVAEWGREVLHEKMRDTHTDLEPGAETPDGASAVLESLPEIEAVKPKLDLSFVSTPTLYEVCTTPSPIACAGATVSLLSTVGPVNTQTSASHFRGELIHRVWARIPKKYLKHANVKRS
jgi:hypothetical protein